MYRSPSSDGNRQLMSTQIERTNDGCVHLLLDRTIVRCHAGVDVGSNVGQSCFGVLVFRSHAEDLREQEAVKREILLTDAILCKGSTPIVRELLSFATHIRHHGFQRRSSPSANISGSCGEFVLSCEFPSVCFKIPAYFRWLLFMSTGFAQNRMNQSESVRTANLRKYSGILESIARGVQRIYDRSSWEAFICFWK